MSNNEALRVSSTLDEVIEQHFRIENPNANMAHDLNLSALIHGGKAILLSNGTRFNVRTVYCSGLIEFGEYVAAETEAWAEFGSNLKGLQNTHTLIDVDSPDGALCRFHYPVTIDAGDTWHAALRLKRSVRAKAWLENIETVTTVKGLLEFIEDFGDVLFDDPNNTGIQQTQLELCEALKTVSAHRHGKAEASYSPHGDSITMSVVTKVETPSNRELPISLTAKTKIWQGIDHEEAVKVKLNWYVDEDTGKPMVRCKVSNKDEIEENLMTTLVERIKDELDGSDQNIRVIW